MHALILSVHQIINAPQISFKAQADEGFFASHSGIGNLPEILSCGNIGNMDFNRRQGNGFERIENCNARVSISGGVYDYPVELAESRLNFINYAAFVIGLKKLHLNALFSGIIVYHCAKVGIGVFAVDIWLPDAEHVDIGSVYYKDTHSRILLTVISGSALTSTVKSAVSR